jgi:hypothetical protein
VIDFWPHGFAAHISIQSFGSNPAGFAKTVPLGAGQTLITEACAGRTLAGSTLDDLDRQ